MGRERRVGHQLRQALPRVGRQSLKHIRPNPTRKVKVRCDSRRYRDRNVIERCFCCGLKRCRRVATRYEKKAANFAGFVWLASLVIGQIT